MSTAAPVPRVPRRSVEEFLSAHESQSAATRARQVRSAEEEAQFDALQTAIGLALADLDPQDQNPTMWAPEIEILAQVQSFMAEQATAAPTPAPDEVKYDDRDILGWATSFFDWWRKIVKHRFIEATPASVIDIPNDARVAVFGDWGSGRYGAPKVAASITRIQEPVHAVIHLGDTYYAGTQNEIAKHLLAIWPRRPDARSFTLNGNHEMYGGGLGYFKALEEFEQPSSYFALRNDGWLIVGLDTAYSNGKLHGGQVEWLKSLVDGAGSRRIILLSHHQPFSAFEKGYAGLLDALQPLLGAGRIHAWLWGHEHKLTLYDKHAPSGLLGRCVGHGGYPYFRVTKKDGWEEQGGDAGSRWFRFPAASGLPGGRVLADGNPYVEDDPERYGAHGFATLVLHTAAAEEEYRNADGVLLHKESL